MKKSNIRILAVAALALAALAGCKTFELKTPKGYVTYYRASTYYRAVSPDNAVIRIRSWPNKPKGSLKFWSEVVERELRYSLGYKMAKKSDVATSAGNKGVRLDFTVASRGRLHTYIVAIFVTKKRIFAFEATTFSKYLKRHGPAFEKALASLKLK